MLGLKADGEKPLIEAMLGNFMSLVERYGHVPNGTRSYYLTRSQPPFLSFMMDLSDNRSEEHTSELQSLMRISYAVFCLKKKITRKTKNTKHTHTDTTHIYTTDTHTEKHH